jgi:orotate phosphoribosyltransferase
MKAFQNEFIQLALQTEVLLFGEFTLKSGRLSPYFFNAGLFNTGESLSRLGSCYANALVDANVQFDMLFGPAYKGIPTVAAVACALYREHGISVPWSFNRKEAKDHGEAGIIVGAPLKGRVLIIDDVISAGTAARESVQIIRASGAQPSAMLIALDRQEVGTGARSAVQEAEQDMGLSVSCIIALADLIEYLEGDDSSVAAHLLAVKEYRTRYGASA